jgi:hypothetical protein
MLITNEIFELVDKWLASLDFEWHFEWMLARFVFGNKDDILYALVLI